MPPREGGGFFSRLGRGIRNLFRGPGREERPETPPPPPTPQRGRGAPPVPVETQLQRVYVNVTGSRTGYYDWLDLFNEFNIFERDEQAEMFDGFLRSHYLTTRDPGHITRGEFYRNAGMPYTIHPSGFATSDQINWDEWRSAMGYSRR